MKALISILIIAGVAFGAYKVWEYWDTVSLQKEAQEQEKKTEISPDELPGMPPALDQSFRNARAGGAATLKVWLDQYRRNIADPRLASVELDYVVLISKDDPVEAKKLFAKIKQRVPPNSPVYPRIKSLEKTYE